MGCLLLLYFRNRVVLRFLLTAFFTFYYDSILLPRENYALLFYSSPLYSSNARRVSRVSSPSSPRNYPIPSQQCRMLYAYGIHILSASLPVPMSPETTRIVNIPPMLEYGSKYDLFLNDYFSCVDPSVRCLKWLINGISTRCILNANRRGRKITFCRFNYCSTPNTVLAVCGIPNSRSHLSENVTYRRPRNLWSSRPAHVSSKP